MMVPADPTAHLVMVQPDLAVARLEDFLDAMPHHSAQKSTSARPWFPTSPAPKFGSVRSIVSDAA